MDLLKPLVRHLTYDLYLRRDGNHPGPHRRHLAESQYRTSGEIGVLQLKALRRLVRDAAATSAFYRKRFEACGFEPGDLRCFSDFAQLPILTKEQIRNELSASLSEGFTRRNAIAKRTGGSTGVPLHTCMDYPAARFKRAAVERHNAWAGLRPGERVAVVWGDTEKPQSWRARLRTALMTRAFYLDTLRFESGRIETFLRRIHRHRPRVLLGHAHSLFRLAEYVRDRGISGIWFPSVITTAMVLSGSERRTIAEVFGAQVFDRYGCEELSLIASECEAHDGLHIFAEGVYVETLDRTADRPGRLIITDLVNRAMPLIRYEIGDYGTLASGPCRCGRGLPRLRDVAGRIADFLYRPDRVAVFGISVLDTFVIHIPGFRQVQIVQDRFDHLDFYIVRDATFSDESLTRLDACVREVFGTEMSYDLHFVTEIPQTPGGKYRFSICRIPEDERP